MDETEGGIGGEKATAERRRVPMPDFLRGDAAHETLHTLLFLVFGLGTTLAYGLGTSSVSIPKWLFLMTGAATAALWCALHARDRRRLSFDGIEFSLFAFCGYAGLSVFWSHDRGSAALELAGYLALGCLFLYARRCDADRLAFRIGLVALLTIAALLARSLLVPTGNAGFGNDNHFAGTLLLAVPFALLWFHVRTDGYRLAGPVLAAAALTWLVGVNGSRMEYAVFAGLAAIAVLLWTSQRYGWRAAFALAAAGALAAVLLVWLAWDRLVEIYPFRERVELYVNTFALWRERPVFGHGLGGFDYAFPRFQQYHLTLFPPEQYPAFGVLSLHHAFRLADAAHNEVLQTFAELGVVGATLAALFLFAPIRTALADYDKSPLVTAGALSLGALIVLALLGSPLRSPSTGMFAALALGILARREDPDTAPVRIPLARAPAVMVALLGVLVLAGTLYASAVAYRAAREHGLAQAYRAQSPYISLVLELRAHQRFPLAPQYRRQVYLNYVDWYSQTRERSNPKAPDEQMLFRTAISAGPYVTGILLVRIRYLLLRRPGTYEREEIELRLSALKAWVPYLIEVHVAEAAYARSIGDHRRAERALREAVRVKQLRERAPLAAAGGG